MMRSGTSLIYFAHGGPAGWEALCVDFDISVHGETFDEVKALLDHAVQAYVRAASDESAATRPELLGPIRRRGRSKALFQQ